MPSDRSIWLVAIPHAVSAETLLSDVGNSSHKVSNLAIPSFKIGTLDSLIALSEELPKYDTFFTALIAKMVDIWRKLFNDNKAALTQHILVDGEDVADYMLNDWKWNESKYAPQRDLQETVDVLNKDMAFIDHVMKSKLNAYDIAKGSLTQLRRKGTGDLSVRSLVGVVSKDDFVPDSEYLETLLVSVPKNLVKVWNAKYERLTSMVVPRSCKAICSDNEYTLFSVIVFRRTHDEFVQRCRENKFIVRDFVYHEELIANEQEEIQIAESTERELRAQLVRLTRANFSEAYQVLVHLKVVRLFVESVLRYGLPADYIGLAIKPEPRSTPKLLSLLANNLSSKSSQASSGLDASANPTFAAEYQSLMDQDFFSFVLFEVPLVET
ncbi:hypothetical protein SERLA73DRAFT_181053 [Serpula lacrymans var. lacrymans S7.3]|uniref:V-type proton ATPase subunit C n=2 Tax=Serpula lacrymans var. lacrymans TaxID=341189 RepID=F8PUQ0_SERL3|nr:uncharacterized protein SERLADRAFT_466931 [Serpula lacrymans var. lacrymans S7.9]EGO00458.1 hypothetical protein SERLA73DRAFT_181053 [Serpula lacrymans var. lacrymans S7.3]EGO26009.1 hypothetical protein SERLADRAFT_466931 [Serpula lacrymans var. lacrymans S7.9]